jgi:hypothetical protein
MDNEMTALAAAMATVGIEPEKRSSMIISFRDELRHARPRIKSGDGP